MPHLDLTITLGNLVSMVGIIGAIIGVYYGVVNQLGILRFTLNHHAERLSEHASRLEKYETSMFTVMGDVQHIMGRMEILTERRSNPR